MAKQTTPGRLPSEATMLYQCFADLFLTVQKITEPGEGRAALDISSQPETSGTIGRQRGMQVKTHAWGYL